MTHFEICAGDGQTPVETPAGAFKAGTGPRRGEVSGERAVRHWCKERHLWVTTTLGP